jgi:2-keto-3-deoxy-L-rhamnonate aldolase RhmA
MEHDPGDILMLLSQLQAMNGTGVTPLLRAPSNDLPVIKRILDAGEPPGGHLDGRRGVIG